MLPTTVPRLGLAVVTAASLAVATGCGATDVAEPIATAGNGPSDPTSPTAAAPTSSSPASTAPAITTSSAVPVSTTGPSTGPTATAAPAPTTTGPPEPSAIELPIPRGSFETGPDDLFVQLRSGDLELWSGALTRLPERRTLVAEYPDPFAVFSEGTGPNAVDHVAGEVGGTVVFGDCCEPISGNVLAATDVGEAAPISGGYSPTLSPTRDLLGTANDYVVTQTATDPTGAGLSRQLNEQAQQPYLNVADLTWSSNATAAPDDDHMVLLTWSEDGWWLHDVDRTTLESPPTLDLGVPPVFEAPDTTMVFAGHGPNSEIVVAEGTPQTTRLRYFDPATLAELTTMERTLPGSVDSIRLAADGVGLLWVDDGGSLYHLPAGDVDATRLATDVLAAWFA